MQSEERNRLIATWIKSAGRTKQERLKLFERLTADTHRQAYNMAMRLTSNRTEAEDLVQETFVRAYRFFHRYDENLPFTSWIYRIMTNLHIDAMRKKTRLRTVSMDQSGSDGSQTWDLPDETASTDSEVMESTLEEPLQLGLKAMTSEFRTAVVLADIEGLSYEEIADVMQTSVGTVRSRIHRGRRQLREYLGRNCPGRYEETLK
ncbi:MAG TPA: sigma-70 family RNA polymerase sigma factor [Fimbriimonadaceae bacterium]|nr:sigma-70 family RNA polymerase sigma factor [Fimbriimonadaceae bacterium]